MPSLWDDYCGLERSPAGLPRYRCAPVASHEETYLARLPDDRPVFLMATIESDALALDLRNVRVSHGLRAEVLAQGSGSQWGIFTLIECRSGDPELQRLFTEAVGNLMPRSKSERTSAGLSRLVQKLAELFSALDSPGRREALGLWGEMFAIAQSRDPVRLTRAWHSEVDAQFDFAEELERLEVKTTTRLDRRHEFAHVQLTPPDPVVCTIVSIVTERIDSGTTLEDLRREILLRLDADIELRAKIDRCYVEALGADWRRAGEQGFDRRLAENSLRLFDTTGVPRIQAAVPNGVTNVRYESCLAIAQPLSQAHSTLRPLARLIPIRPQ
jgi:hypothetical protein